MSGKELDASMTVTIGYGSGSVSGSLGVGKTTGKTDWVENQTSIVARDRLDIRTEDHTQIDGAVIASRTGNLKLDTGTLGFRDIEGEDKEHSYYINAGGSYGWGGANSNAQKDNQPATGASVAVQDKSQEGKGEEGANGWSLSGYDYRKEREQIVRATVGEGEIVVRSDAETGKDSTAGLNRDPSKAYEITKDDEERTDLYVSKSSVEAVAAAAARISREIQAQRVSADQIPESAKKQLGEERALAMAKNLARHGLDPTLMENLSPETAQRLASWADRAENYNKAYDTAGGSDNASSSGGQVTNGVLDLGKTTVEGGPRTSGEALLLETSRFQEYLGTLPVEEAQLALLGMQALMGPAKAAVSLAGNALLNSLFGDKIDALKETAAVGMTAGLSDRERSDVQEDHDYAKQEHAAGNEYYPLDGDGYVLASRFLIDLVAGEIGSLAGKVAGRAIGIVPGKGSEQDTSNGAKGSATGKAALPAGYREGSSAGAGFAETAGLPDGYRRVINTKTGNTEVLAADGKLYLETAGGLKPKAGGNLAGLVNAEKQIASAKEPTRFIDGVKVVDQKTGQVFQGTVDLGPTLDRIKSGGSFPHRNDGSIFQNRAGDLPKKPADYYTEYVHPTPGVSGPGPQRIVVGKGGEMYYTADHYKSFIPIKN